jgi:hypothetical protein
VEKISVKEVSEMGSGQRSNNLLVIEASSAMEKFKHEIANELNIDTSKIQGGYWGYVTSRETGAVGGNMVRRMIEAAERSLAEQTLADVKAGFQAGLTTSAQNTQTMNTQNQNQSQQYNQFKFQ